MWEVLPSISQVLFDGGKLKSIEDATIVQRDITIVEYEITVQKAFRDVANGISNTELMSKKISILDESTKISRQAYMDQLIDELIKLAFAEDVGDGDHTTLSCIPETAMGRSQLIIKEDGVLAGVEMAKRIFHHFDPSLKVTVFIQDLLS